MANNENIFFCRQLNEHEYSWSITSRLSDILSIAEHYFGERNKEYSIIGIEIEINTEQPYIWYPTNDLNSKHLIIRITENCINNMNEAIFEVAHECVHCLCPTSGKNATILEEGLATWFSIHYTSRLGINIQPSIQNYQKAYELVSDLLKYDFDIIKKARKQSPNISDITKELLMNICPNINPHLVNELTKPFDYNQ